MLQMHNEICHNLEVVTVRDRLNQLLASIRRDYAGVIENLCGDWEGDTLHVSFRAYGFDIASDVHIGDHILEWDGTISDNADLFRGKIQRTIQLRLAEVLGAGRRRAA